MSLSKRFGTFLTVLFFLAGLSTLYAEDEINSNWRGLAIDGFDPVAYFTKGKPTEGNSEYSYQWKGATFRFASAENMQKFEADPKKYAPQYGGYCAYGVAQGVTVDIDPDAWKIVNGKLFLNYSREIQKRWEKDIPGYVAKANKNWPKVLQ